MMKRLAAWAFSIWASAGIAAASCGGSNLFDTMPQDQRDVMIAAADAAPFPTGNLWEARSGTTRITIVGTVHVADPRNALLLDRVWPRIAEADLVVLEGLQADMKDMARVFAESPEIAFIMEGEALRDMLTPDEWALMRQEMVARGVPGFLAGRMQPWLAITTLALPACVLAQGESGIRGLDALIEDLARDTLVPVQGLEDYTILLEIFDQFSEEELVDFLRATLLITPYAEDIHATTLDSYFAGQHRLLWEFGRYWMPEDLEDQFDLDAMQALYTRIEEVMLASRNRDWIDYLLGLPEGGSIVLAVGAAHLSGPDGVLDLLDRAGYALTEITD